MVRGGFYFLSFTIGEISSTKSSFAENSSKSTQHKQSYLVVVCSFLLHQFERALHTRERERGTHTSPLCPYITNQPSIWIYTYIRIQRKSRGQGDSSTTTNTVDSLLTISTIALYYYTLHYYYYYCSYYNPTKSSISTREQLVSKPLQTTSLQLYRDSSVVFILSS